MFMTLKSEDRLPVDYKGFLYRKINNALILNSNDFDTAVKVMKADNIRHLEINSNFFKKKELSFLSEFNFIDGLSIISPSINDISPIHTLSNLKVLNIDHKLPGQINFQVFKNLEECFFTWGIQGCETIFNVLTLHKLRIDNYDKLEIIELSKLKKLNNLALYYSGIVNLLGISSLKKLIKLDLTGSKLLEDIGAVKELKGLEELRLDDCKNLSNLEPVKDLKKLKSLSFNNIGNLSSIKYLSSLNKLEEIIFSDNTNIEDGDLNSLQILYQKGNLKKSIFKSRMHYTHKPQDLGFKVPDAVANIFRKK